MGRFLSADPFVQDPSNLQSLNPYSYVQNNPLSYVDPSGHFLSGLFKAIGKFFSRVFHGIVHAVKAVLSNSIIRAIIQIAVCAATAASGPGICAATSALLTLGSGGTPLQALKAFAMTLVSAAVWGGAGIEELGGGVHGFLDRSAAVLGDAIDAARVLVHGTVAGALTVAQGGNFFQGFAAGAIGEASAVAMNGAGLSSIQGQEGVVIRTAIASVAGGTASVLTGGKFANGAITAAFAHLYNDEKLIGKNPLNLGNEYSGRLDRFNTSGGQASFEIHVYDPNGNEVGIYGEEGWMNKHGLGTPEGIPQDVENRLKGIAIDELRKMGVVPEKGEYDIKGKTLLDILKDLGRALRGGPLIIYIPQPPACPPGVPCRA